MAATAIESASMATFLVHIQCYRQHGSRKRSQSVAKHRWSDTSRPSSFLALPPPAQANTRGLTGPTDAR